MIPPSSPPSSSLPPPSFALLFKRRRRRGSPLFGNVDPLTSRGGGRGFDLRGDTDLDRDVIDSNISSTRATCVHALIVNTVDYR